MKKQFLIIIGLVLSLFVVVQFQIATIQKTSLVMQAIEENTRLRQITQLQEDIIFLNDLGIDHQIVLNAITDDYPSKKPLSEREWCGTACLERSKRSPAVDNR